MDKNKIHIDEFVRNMLSDREEEKPAGAWGGMRQLLDQAMPVAGTVAGAAFNWKRFLGIASAVVVIGGLSLGGYHLLDDPGNGGGKDLKNATALAEAAGTAAEDQNNATPTSGENAEAALPSGSGTGITTPSGSAETAPSFVAASGTAAHRPEGMSKTSGSGNNSAVNLSAGTASASPYVDGAEGHSAATAGRANGISAASAVAGRTGAVSGNRAGNAAGRSAAAGRRSTAQQRSDAPSPASAATTGRTAASGRNTGGGAGRHSGNSGSASTAPASVQLAGASSAHASRPHSGAGSSGSANHRDNMHGSTSTANTTSGNTAGARSAMRTGGMMTDRSSGTASRSLPLGSSAAQPGSVVTDNIIELRQYFDPQSRAWKLDTIGTYQRQRPVARPDAEEPGTAPQRRNTPPRRSYGPNPDAAAYLPASGSGLLAQTAPKAAGRKSGDMYEKEGGISLTATIDRTRSAFSQIHWQPGLVGALDASFGKNSFFGFQAGFSSLFLVNEKWSFGLEARYNRLANRGAVVKDDYLSTVEAGANRWTEDTVSHFFSFPSLQALQLPLFVRREIGRFFALAGANLTYAFSVNAEEREQRRGTTTIITGYLPPNTNLGMQRSPSVVYQDFNQRFGFGYTLGAGYAISPALQTDIRLTQMVWDNAAGKGAQRVSKELYRAPSVQFSISYRFNTKPGLIIEDLFTSTIR